MLTPISNNDQSVTTFVLSALLEIPRKEIVHLQEKLTNLQSISHYCESCTKLIYSAQQIYTEILHLAQKYRQVQKQIVEQISNGSGSHNCGVTLSPPNHNEILDFCRNFLNKNNFNGFCYPFIVNKIPVKDCAPLSTSSSRSAQHQEEDLAVEEIKEEPISADENDKSDEDCQIGEGDEGNDNLQHSSSTSAAEEEDDDNQSESDSDFEPPPPKKAVKKIPLNKAPSSSPPKKENRKSSPAASSKPPRKKYKPIPPVKQSKFDLLYPDYPKRLRDPTTKKFHCLEPPCSKMYQKKTELERHVIIQHLQDNFYKCEEPLCGKSYAQREHFEDHVSWHAGIPRWKCQEKVTTTTTTSDGISSTLQCPKAFYNRKKLNRHVQKVHYFDKPFICETCGKSFHCQDNLTAHRHNRHTEKGRASSSKYVPRSSGSGIHICNYCGKTFKVRINLETHINLVHEQTVGKYGCQFCEHRFRWKTTLKQHLWNEHQFSLEGYQPPKKKTKIIEKNFQCEVKGCRKPFMKEETWRRHMEEKHGKGKEGIYEFNCKYCGKGFHLRAKLDFHEEAHENKESKPFNCENCGRRFATLPYLKMHRWNVHKIGSEKARKNK